MRVHCLVIALLSAFVSCWPVPIAAEPLAITTNLPDFRMFSVGDSLRVELTAKGGTPPYIWSLDPKSFPPGVTIQKTTSATTLQYWLTGSLDQPGSWPATVTVTDSGGGGTTATLNLTVSRMRLTPRSYLATPGQFFRVALRAEGGVPPYRITLRPGSYLSLGVQFDPEKGEFYGVPALPSPVEHWMEIYDSSGDLLRTTFSFNFQGPASTWAYNVFLEELSCAVVRLQGSANPPGTTVGVAVDWGDGAVENGLLSPVSLTHAYQRDGKYEIGVQLRDTPSGQVVNGAYEIQVNRPGLCDMDLRLKPQALYLVRGTRSGRFRVDSRTIQGDLYPLDNAQFSWSSTDPSLAKVDETGTVNCSGTGEATIEAVSQDGVRIGGGKVFCGEYMVEPSLVNLSLKSGRESVQLSVRRIDPEGANTAVDPTTVRYSVASSPSSADLVTINGDAVALRRGPRTKTENAGVSASIGSQASRNFGNIHAVDFDLPKEVSNWSGQYISLWSPDRIGTLSYADIIRSSDAVRVADLIYLLEQEEAGLRPSGGGMQHLSNLVGYGGDPGTPCGGSGNPLGLGTFLDSSPASGCFIGWYPLSGQAIPDWNVWGHEMGHGFHGESRKFSQLIAAGSLPIAEAVASHHDCYALWFLEERSAIYKVPHELLTYWHKDGGSGCQFDRTFDDLKRYLATGPDIHKIDVGGIFDIMMVLRTEYGWEAQRRFFSAFLPAYGAFPFAISGLGQQTTFFAAAYSAATRTDLRERFRNQYGFPIDDAWYAAHYADIERLVRQRDPAVTAGPDILAQAGVALTLSKPAAFDPSDQPMTHLWRIVQHPANSRPVLSNTSSLNPSFTPDLPGAYTLSLTAADPLFTSKASVVNINVPALTAVSNAASAIEGVIAPGEYVALYGSAFGPLAAVTATRVQKGLGGVKVTFNGIEAFLTYVSSAQINGLVPYGISGKVDIVVEYQGVKTGAFTVQAVEATPGIFTRQYGPGQAWVVNQDQTFNSDANPAARTSIIAFWATGQGLIDPLVSEADPIVGPDFPRPQLPVKVTIGGIGAQVMFSGLVYPGVLQVNARIPENAPVGSGIELLLAIGNNASRKGVTVAIK